MQTFAVIGWSYFKLEHSKFWSNFEFDRNIVSGTDAWDLTMCCVLFASHTVNLLTNMPADSYEELLTPMIEDAAGGEKADIDYDGKNMEAIQALLEFLKKRLDKVRLITAGSSCLV